MGRLDCAARGPETRLLPCGCPSGVRLFACNNPAVDNDECALIADSGKRGQAIADAAVPICLNCEHRVSPPPPVPLALFGSQSVIMHDSPHPIEEPLPNRIWRQSRSRRLAEERQERQRRRSEGVVVQSDVDT